jgi:hypothetical protein
MVDRMYRRSLPRLRASLERLRRDFARFDAGGAAWIAVRIDPLLRHARALEARLAALGGARVPARFTGAVPMLHADLVYLRANVAALERILDARRRARRASRCARAKRD